MKFKIDPIFEKYWPPLPDEKFIILEKSILDEGLRENLTVWKEKNILLDGHQRLRVLKKHGISFEDRITYLSFSDEVHAKHWVHVTQAARRGDAPAFLSICHVMEFEPIYREEAAQRQLEGQKKGGLIRQGKSASVSTDTEAEGRYSEFMARDAGCKSASISRVVYIHKHDPARFEALAVLAASGEAYDHGGGTGRGKDGKEISIHLEWSKVQAAHDAEKAGVKLDTDALETFKSSNTVRDFADSVTKFRPPVSVQKTAAEAIVANQKIADKNYVEDAVIHRMPKKRTPTESEKPALTQLENSMNKISDALYMAIGEMKRLQEMRCNPGFGDNLYFQALANAANLRAAFAEWVVMAKLINQKGEGNEKQKDKTRNLLQA